MLRVLVPAPCLLALIATPPTQDREVYAMGTRLKLHLEAADPVAAAEVVLAEVERIEAACSTWRPGSSWSRLNGAEGAWQPLDREWLELLERTRSWSLRTGGAFDPALPALLRLRGLRAGAGAGEPAKSGFGCHLLEVDPLNGRARLREGAGIDEGGFLKGYALDAAHRAARSASGWMDFGGQLLAWGRPQRVEIADPARRDRPRAVLQLRDASLSTTGCSERGRHILDPRSGLACAPWGSASVVAASAFEADLLSTAVYVLGPEAGLAWASAEDIAVLFLLNDGRRRMSPAFAALRPAFLPGDPE